ncbi:hypothetical protein FH041_09705 [Pseudomonas sp. SWI7]|uniref:hypothetical protein n=1 Tax=Pseudomonas sp. SWI7 TaxID=2587597 RepID=UPI00111FCB77|nr:hypothetical protein [Pseudomonas sp. SWI7]QDC05181.1 hypothetical protein FH041_09705 [Pseudomonas sp. SWI7]
MNLRDCTKNQHFVSQYEQRLNAINPDAPKKKQRIYEYGVIDRESYSVQLNSAKGKLIQNALSLHDLFSFDILGDGGERYNFELLFNQYEAQADGITKLLRAKIMQHGCDVRGELIGFFRCKFLNFIRNPYSLRKMLNSFPNLALYKPTNSVHLENFERVLNGRRPHQRYLCELLGISDAEYCEWLSAIFLLLTPLGRQGKCFFDELVDQFFESSDYYRIIFVYTYTNHQCLLSDRGFSIPAISDDLMAFDFNFFSNGFIRYAFQSLSSTIAGATSARAVEQIKSGLCTEAHHYVDNLEVLKHYNRQVIYQCHGAVFSSSTKWYNG